MGVKVEQVEAGVQRVHCRSWRGAAVGYDVSAYLIDRVLVDSGFASVGDEFLRTVRSLSVRGVIVTHQHEDHTGNAPTLAREGVPLRMHPGCEAVLRERPPIGFYRRVVWGRPARLTAALLPFDPSPLEMIALPGHTPDHLAVWDPVRRILVSGDLFLGVKVRVAHHDEAPMELVKSLRHAAALEPRLLLDAHRGPLRNPVALLNAKADWMEATMEKITSLSNHGVSERDITRRVLGREDLVGWVSRGEYSKRSLVHAMLMSRPA